MEGREPETPECISDTRHLSANKVVVRLSGKYTVFKSH